MSFPRLYDALARGLSNDRSVLLLYALLYGCQPFQVRHRTCLENAHEEGIPFTFSAATENRGDQGHYCDCMCTDLTSAAWLVRRRTRWCAAIWTRC